MDIQEPGYLQFAVLMLLPAADIASCVLRCLFWPGSHSRHNPVLSLPLWHQERPLSHHIFLPIKQWSLFLAGLIKFAWQSCDVKFDCYDMLTLSSLFKSLRFQKLRDKFLHPAPQILNDKSHKMHMMHPIISTCYTLISTLIKWVDWHSNLMVKTSAPQIYNFNLLNAAIPYMDFTHILMRL